MVIDGCFTGKIQCCHPKGCGQCPWRSGVRSVHMFWWRSLTRLGGGLEEESSWEKSGQQVQINEKNVKKWLIWKNEDIFVSYQLSYVKLQPTCRVWGKNLPKQHSYTVDVVQGRYWSCKKVHPEQTSWRDILYTKKSNKFWLEQLRNQTILKRKLKHINFRIECWTW